MENREKDGNSNESSLLLQMPRSMFSYDMSGNSFLMPVVAVETKNDAPSSTQNAPEKSEIGGNDEFNSGPLCQLEQPLMMRRTSPAPQPQLPPAPQQQFPPAPQQQLSPAPQQQLPPTSQPQLSSSFKQQLLSSSLQQLASPSQQLLPSTSLQQLSSHSLQQLPSTPSQGYNLSGEYSGNTHGYASQEPQVSATPATVPLFESHSSTVPLYSAQQCEPQMYTAPPDYYSQPSATVPATMHEYNTNNGIYVNQAGNHSAGSLPRSDSRNFESHPFDVTPLKYEPLKPYWLFRDIVESKEIWLGFSETDSANLETTFQQDPLNGIVQTDGGRYDVHLSQRIKKSVYFEVKDLHVRRSTWFYKSEGLQRFVPYEEETALMLEQHYYNCVTTGQWHKTLSLPGSGIVMMESPQVILHYSNSLDVWPVIADSKVSPRVTKRGLPDEVELMPDESTDIDHLVFVVQGIGSFCDLRFRTVSQCVDGFRDIANRLISSHFRKEVDFGKVKRVEFLPLAWHAKLHTSNVGLDRRLQSLTLPSIPKLRHFTNDTLLDILLYSSPSYCQAILDTVASELNSLYSLFLARNPTFGGKVSVAGHSLGSLILFDILANQPSSIDELETKIDNISLDPCKNILTNIEKRKDDHLEEHFLHKFTSIENLLESLNLNEYAEIFQKEKIDLSSLPLLTESDLKELGLPKGPCKILLNFLHSKDKEFSLKPQAEQQLVSNEENSECLKNSESTYDYHDKGSLLDESATQQSSIFPERPPKTCMSTIVYPRLHFEPACFFALGSPISMFLAVRGYETISEDFRFPTCPAFFHIFHPYDPVAFRVEPLIDPNFLAKPVMIPHHKGRKRMHIEIRENLTKVGSEIKQKVIETLRYTWNSLSGFAKSHTFPSAAVEAEVEKMVKEQMSSQTTEDVHDSNVSETSVEDIQIGCLNGGRRIDYVLQEKPIEALNDYIFALTSHATYWDSEDTVLMILKEIYAIHGIQLAPLHEIRQYLQQSASRTSLPHDQSSERVHFRDPMRTENHPETVENYPSSYVPYTNLPYAVSTTKAGPFVPEHNASISTSQSAQASQPLAPPPLSGFVKKSAFAK